MPRPKRDARKRQLTELFVKKVKPEKRAFLVWDSKQHGLALPCLAVVQLQALDLHGLLDHFCLHRNPFPTEDERGSTGFLYD